MDCERIRDLLSDYLEEELDDGDRAIVAAHLEACARCAADAKGLSETIALLAALPREKAPPELLAGIMSGIERESAGTRGWRNLFPGRRVRIPLEAAAAVFLALLVYGIQREMPVRSGLPTGDGGTPQATATPTPDTAPPAPAAPPSARYTGQEPSAVASREEPPGPAADRVPLPAPAAAPESFAPPAALARAESREAGSREAAMGKAEPFGVDAYPGGAASAPAAAPARPVTTAVPAAPALPAATAARVSSAGEAIEPKVFAAPPSRMLEPLPFGREVTLEVMFADRAGIEERIVAAAERLGGGAHPGAVPRAAGEQSLLPAPIRVHLPADSAGAFLDTLKGLGKIPPEGMPVAADLPAGPSPGIVAYTVRIRIR